MGTYSRNDTSEQARHLVHQTPTCWGKPQSPASNGRCHNLPYEKIGKNEPVCIADEVPFEIPESWEWVRLGSVCQLIDGKKLQNKTYNNLDARYMRGKAEAKVLETGKFVTKGTYLILVDGENSGEVFIAPEDGYMGSTFKILWISTQLYAQYMLKFIELYKEPLRNSKKGAAIPHLNKEIFFNLLLPIPSLQEQTRIVDKIVTLTPSVEQYDLLSIKSDELNRKFPDFLKKSILQYAVQGKLVPQDPTDEPASVLLDHIRTEKEQLIKSGKIKRDKHESVIFRRDNSYYERVDGIERCIDDEIPFEIPESWEWVRLNSISKILNGDRGKNYPSKSTLSSIGIPFISALNLDGNTVVQDENLLCMTEEQYNRLGNGKLIKNDIVVCIRGSLGKHGRYPFEKGAIASSLTILRPYYLAESIGDYIMLWLDSPAFFKQIRKYDNGTAQPNLAAKSFEQFLIPLPPHSEQHRIITKVEMFFSKLKTL